MTSPSSPHLLSSLKLLSRVASVIVISVGGFALVGWMLMSTDVWEKKPAEEPLRFASQYARSLEEKKLWQVGAFKDVEVVTVIQSTTVPDFAVD
jgi:hypothetical protein